MSTTPETRPSMLLRLRDQADGDAWQAFESVYWPLIFQAARSQGLQDADARDVTQGVLIRVSERIETFVPDHTRARFRTWLATLTRHAITDHIRARGRRDVSIPADGSHDLEVGAADDDIEQLIERDYQRQVFRWAASVVESEFSREAWQAFWQTAVVGLSIAETARQLGRSTGSVYASRSRIMRRLKEQVCEFDAELEREP